MKKVAIIYDTVSGSTADMSAIIQEELQKAFAVTSMGIRDVASLEPYDAVLIGSPMRFGWCTSRVRKFIKRNRAALAGKKVGHFFGTLYIVRIPEESADESRLFLDPGLAIATIPQRKANAMDRAHSLGYYERRRRKCAPEIEPVSVAYFKGRLVLSRLPLLERIFMTIVTALTAKEQEGEFLNPAVVRDWAAEVSAMLGVTFADQNEQASLWSCECRT